MNKKLLIILIAPLLFVASCGREVDSIEQPRVPVPSPVPSPSPTAAPLDVGALFDAIPEDKAVLVPFVTEFIAKGILEGVNIVEMFNMPKKLNIKIGSLDSYGSGVIGLCTSGSPRRVTLDPDFFMRVSDAQSQLLVDHELGHCILNRPHRSDVGIIKDNVSHSHSHVLSIMHPIILSSSEYSGHKPYYDRELFTEVAVDGVPAKFICGE